MSRLHISSFVRPFAARGRVVPKRFRPRFEGLEERTVLSTVMAEGIAERIAAHRATVLAHEHLRAEALREARLHRLAAHLHLTPTPSMTSTPPQSSPMVPAPPPTSTTTAPASATTTTTTTTSASDPTLVTLDLKPLDLKLLGLEVKTSEIKLTVSAQPGSGELLGNLLTTASGLVNLQGVNNALNTVLANVVTLANSASLDVSGVNTSGPLGSATQATTPVLTVHIAPVNLNLLGAVVTTSPVNLSIIAHSGSGLVLGNVVTDLANLLNTPPANGKLDINFVNKQLQTLLNELNTQIPGISAPATTTSTTTTSTGTTQVLSLAVPPINLNLLGLVLTTGQIKVNADTQTGNGDLLGNFLHDLLNTLGATPQNLSALNSELNQLLAKVVGVLNATSLTLPSNALSSLSQVLQTLSLPNLVTASGTASAPILNLDIAATSSNPPPVDVNLLGLVITTSNIDAQLTAKTGNGQVLGNLVYNVAHLLDPGGSTSLLTILNELGV